MGIQINGQTDTVTSTTSGGTVKITPASIVVTGVSTFSDIRITGGTIAGVSTAGITTAYIGSVNDGPIAGTRNRVINGDMRIDQRNAGASVSGAAGVYPVDRFEIENLSGGGTATGQRSTTVPTGQGFTNSLLITVTGTDTSLAAGDYYTIRHIIEGQNISDLQFGTGSASTVTISFWVRSSIAGIYCFSLTNGGNSRGYPVEYNISSANTWEKKVITIPGDVTGTWGSDNGRGIQCRFCMGTGTSRQGTANSWNAGEIHGTSNQTNLFATNGATFYITGVQLEVGKVATPFEYRSYGQELALCQRYFYVLPAHYHFFHKNSYYESQLYYFPVTMRVSPSITDNGSWVLRGFQAGSNTTYSGFSYTTYTDGFYLGSTTTNNNTFYTWIHDGGTIYASAEL